MLHAGSVPQRRRRDVAAAHLRARRGGGHARLRAAPRAAGDRPHDRHPLRDALEPLRRRLPRRPLARARSALQTAARRALRHRARPAELHREPPARRARRGQCDGLLRSRRRAADGGARRPGAPRRPVAVLLEERQVADRARARRPPTSRASGNASGTTTTPIPSAKSDTAFNPLGGKADRGVVDIGVRTTHPPLRTAPARAPFLVWSTSPAPISGRRWTRRHLSPGAIMIARNRCIDSRQIARRAQCSECQPSRRAVADRTLGVLVYRLCVCGFTVPAGTSHGRVSVYLALARIVLTRSLAHRTLPSWPLVVFSAAGVECIHSATRLGRRRCGRSYVRNQPGRLGAGDVAAVGIYGACSSRAREDYAWCARCSRRYLPERRRAGVNRPFASSR